MKERVRCECSGHGDCYRECREPEPKAGPKSPVMVPFDPEWGDAIAVMVLQDVAQTNLNVVWNKKSHPEDIISAAKVVEAANELLDYFGKPPVRG